MTRELAAYVLEIRIDLKNKIDMLTPAPGMTELQVQKAQTLSTDCKRLEVVLQQFMISEAAAEEAQTEVGARRPGYDVGSCLP